MPPILCKFRVSMIFENWTCEKVIAAETEDRAKYDYYRKSVYPFLDMPFAEFEKFVRCKNLGLADVSQVYGKEAPFRKMCKKRKIEFAYMGMRVQVAGKMGTIVGSYKNELFVVIDGDPFKYRAHPRWEIVYYGENGEVIRDYRKGVYAI